MRLRRAVLKIPAKSSVPPRLPLHNNPSLPNPSQSTLPQRLIPLHFNSFRANVCRKPQGSGPAAHPNVCHLVTLRAPRLGPHRNPRNPNLLIGLLQLSWTPPGVGSPFSAHSVSTALKSPFQPTAISTVTRKPSSTISSLSLFTTHHQLLTPILTSLLLYLVPLLKSVPPIPQEPQCLKP
jgi:hypothetical protein